MAGDRSAEVTLADNAATRRLAAMLSTGNIKVDMSDYGGFEKVGSLPESLPASDTRITTSPGDIMLYQSRNMVIFYGTNTWSYTPIGKIDGATAASVRELLGNGRVTVTLSLQSAGIDEVQAESTEIETVYDLRGNLITARPLPAGVYIINGKKTLIKY